MIDSECELCDGIGYQVVHNIKDDGTYGDSTEIPCSCNTDTNEDRTRAINDNEKEHGKYMEFWFPEACREEF